MKKRFPTQFPNKKTNIYITSPKYSFFNFKICIFVVMISRFFVFIFIIFSLSLSAQIHGTYLSVSQNEGCNTLTTIAKSEFLPTSIDTLIINFGDGQIDTLLSPNSPQNTTHTYNITGDYTISITAINGNEQGNASELVHVYPLPDSGFTYSFYGYPGIKDTFYFSNKRYLFLATNYSNDTTHSWFVNGDIQYSNTDSMAYNFNTISSYIIKHKVNINGCVDSTSQTIDIKKKDIKIPNVFSPNNDGVNDLFYIQTDGETNYKLTIHDRNGSRVFVLEGKTISWDGRAYWGEQLNPGNYFYSLKPESGDAQTGIIYLAR